MASRRAFQLLAAPRSQLVAPRASSLVSRTQCLSFRTLSHTAGTREATRKLANPQLFARPTQRRWKSQPPSSSNTQTTTTKKYSFNDILSLLESPSATTTLIDVREPAEFAADNIPSSVNIPITSQPDALLLDAHDFEDRFGFQKPPTVGHEVVFYCKAGVRSRAAAQLALQGGYESVGEYPGSWLDWVEKGGPTAKKPPAEAGGKGEPAPGKTEVKE